MANIKSLLIDFDGNDNQILMEHWSNPAMSLFGGTGRS